MASFWHIPIQSRTECFCPSSLLTGDNRNRKERLVRSMKLSCCNPQLSQRDKDKRLMFSGVRKDFRRKTSVGQSDERKYYSGTKDIASLPTLSFEQLPREKTNGLNSANNYDQTTPFSYVSAAVPFFLSVFSLHSGSGGSSQHPRLSLHHRHNHRHDHYGDNYPVQYINNNNCNENGKRQFFSEMVGQDRERFSLRNCKSSIKRHAMTRLSIIFIVIFVFILFEMMCGAAANPVPLPTESVSDTAPSYTITSSEIEKEKGYLEKLHSTPAGLSSETFLGRMKVKAKGNPDMELAKGHVNSTKMGISEKENKSKNQNRTSNTARQQMSRSISDGQGQADLKKATLHATLPLTLEVKKDFLVVNSKSFGMGRPNEEPETLLVSDGNDLSAAGSTRNNTRNRQLDYDNSNGSRNFGLSHENNANIGVGTDFSNIVSDNATLPNSTGTCWYAKVTLRKQYKRKRELGKVDHALKLSLISLSSSSSSSLDFSSFTSSSIRSNEHVEVMCNGTHNLASTLNQIPESFVSGVISIHVKDSSISNLNLSLFERFPRLVSLSVTYSNVTHVIGNCPRRLVALNISSNAIRKIDSSVFNESIEIKDGTVGGSGWIDDADEENSDGGEEDYSSDSIGDNEADEGTFSQETRLSSASVREKLASLQKNKSDLVPNGKVIIQTRLNSASDYDENKLLKKMRMVVGTPITKTKLMFSSLSSSSQVSNDYDVKDNDNENNSLLLKSQQQKLPVESLNFPLEKRRFMAVPTNTNENGSSSNDEEENEDNDQDNDPEAKQGNLGLVKMRGDENEGTSLTSFFVGVGASQSTASSDCINSNNKNNSLCKPKLRRKAQRMDDIGVKGYENDDKEDHLPRKSESYTYELDRENYSQRDLRSGVLPSLAPSKKTKRSEDGSRGKGKNEIKVGSDLTSSQHENIRDVVGRSVISRDKKAKDYSHSPMSLEDVDLSHNKISEVPRALLELKSLNSLRLSGNQLKCDFVWDKLADWYMESPDKTILKDGDDTFCGVVDDVRIFQVSSVFQFSVLGVLKAKKDVVETCNKTVDKSVCHDCSLYSLNKVPGHGYNLTHESPHGNVAIALKLDCSFHNLTELPPVPPQTWQLNITGNSIKDLSPLKESMYQNLLILDADTNDISSLDGLLGTTFLEKYNYLNLQNNRFSVIPSNVLSSLKSMRGQGITSLGANYIDCDCDVVRETKPLLLENSKKIKDLKDILCKDLKTPGGDTFMALKDLQYVDLCYMEREESNEVYLYFIIIIELFLIVVIVAKVWHDQRTFRRTGILPWLSQKLPKLPCDMMLETMKEPPHFNRSSSTNVRSFGTSGGEPPASQSISSHVQLREVRSNSGQSEKSSQISQLSSSFPCSSRTSSV